MYAGGIRSAAQFVYASLQSDGWTLVPRGATAVAAPKSAMPFTQLTDASNSCFKIAVFPPPDRARRFIHEAPP